MNRQNVYNNKWRDIMKKILLAMVMVLSLTQNSQAIIIEGSWNPCRHHGDPGECFWGLIFSLPTILISSTEEMSTEDRKELIQAEARNLLDGITTESVLLNAVAEKTGRDVYEVARDILAVK